jgi:hypothetical protein
LALEKPVEMTTPVKNVLALPRSMFHITVQLTTRAGSVRIRSLTAVIAQNHIRDLLIGEDVLKSLGIDPHEILAAQVENRALEAEMMPQRWYLLKQRND